MGREGEDVRQRPEENDGCCSYTVCLLDSRPHSILCDFPIQSVALSPKSFGSTEEENLYKWAANIYFQLLKQEQCCICWGIFQPRIAAAILNIMKEHVTQWNSGAD